MTDLNTWFVQSNNETMEWCQDIMSDNHHYTYRPITDLMAMRNAYLSQVMHHRSYQPEY